jgi:hypothetical protein
VSPVVATDELRSYGVAHLEFCLDHPPPALVSQLPGGELPQPTDGGNGR